MAIYCGIFIWSVINSKIIRLRNRRKWLFYILVLLPPILFATIRYNIGTDYESYWYYYIGNNYSSEYEPLFQLINYISRYIFHDFYGVLLICAILTYGFILASLIKLKEDVSIAIGLWVYYCYYYVASFNVMRQMLAVSIVLYATILLSENKKIKFIILVIIASMFHSSAVLAFAFLLLNGALKVKSKYWMVLLYIGTIGLMFGGGYLLNSLSSILGEYSKYITNTNSIISFSYMLDKLPTFLIIAIPIIIYLKYYRNDSKYDLFCVCGLFSAVILIMGYHFNWFQRVMYYFDIMQVPIVAIIVKRVKLVQNRVIVKILVIGFYLFYFWYSSVFRGSNGGVPYQSLIF